MAAVKVEGVMAEEATADRRIALSHLTFFSLREVKHNLCTSRP